MQYEWIATAAFGLEGIVSRELKALGLADVQTENGGVRFSGTPLDAFRANLRLRCADRVLLLLGRFPALSFEELFQGVSALPWERFLPVDAAFPVRGKCARSQLKSVSDCQAITKKAIATRLGHHYHLERLPETGSTYAVDVSLHGDTAQLTLDTTGEALHRRGYRTWNGEAPLRETLAAAMVWLSPWRPGSPLHDPLCGTGTLVIEAALREAHMAPGQHRTFACESWHFFPEGEMAAERSLAASEADPGRITALSGSDVNPEALELAGRHIRQAGLSDHLSVWLQDVADLTLPAPTGTFLCNPPYGERLGRREDLSGLYRALRDLTRRHPGWHLCLITADPRFEKLFGRRADKKRRLYNGRLECELLTFLASPRA